ncbi:hypothetical protein GM418_10890 [Maribellus comscasis]|uniref:Uncharacterized protein n=1 Tax=Maribellus comscasis TaxID=2681766 RepID=A0A6I6JMJ6_9BACT|nr:hypothetical protein [Maribellus comscasis]QGY44146.1 hypothetical protein GM418_10890 [Maribellus comscasis]
MTRDIINDMSREEKISLLKGLAEGTVEMIGGEPFDMGPDSFAGIVMKDGKEYIGTDYNAELPPDFWDRFQGSSILIPDNGRYEWSGTKRQ